MKVGLVAVAIFKRTCSILQEAATLHGDQKMLFNLQRDHSRCFLYSFYIVFHFFNIKIFVIIEFMPVLI